MVIIYLVTTLHISLYAAIFSFKRCLKNCALTLNTQLVFVNKHWQNGRYIIGKDLTTSMSLLSSTHMFPLLFMSVFKNELEHEVNNKLVCKELKLTKKKINEYYTRRLSLRSIYVIEISFLPVNVYWFGLWLLFCSKRHFDF